MEVRHLGSDKNFKIMKNLIQTIEDMGVVILHNREVVDLFTSASIEIEDYMDNINQ